MEPARHPPRALDSTGGGGPAPALGACFPSHRGRGGLLDYRRAMAPSSTTTAARAPSRNSASIWLRESGVTFSELFASPETASVIDGPRSCLVFWLGTGVAGDDRKAASYEHPPSRLLVARSSWLAVFRSWDNAVNRCESFQSQGHQNMVTVIQQRFFFAHYGLTNHDLETYLAAALSAGGDYADLYFEY